MKVSIYCGRYDIAIGITSTDPVNKLDLQSHFHV